MKIALSKIVGKPLVSNCGITYEFVEALKRLANDPMPVKERYALGRTLEDVARWVKAWEGTRLDILKGLCITRRDWLLRRKHRLEGEITQAEKGEAMHPGLKRLKESLARAEVELADEQSALKELMPASDEAAEMIATRIEAQLAEEVELFLDHKIKLSEESKLTGNEISTLMDLVTV